MTCFVAKTFDEDAAELKAAFRDLFDEIFVVLGVARLADALAARLAARDRKGDVE